MIADARENPLPQFSNLASRHTLRLHGVPGAVVPEELHSSFRRFGPLEHVHHIGAGSESVVVFCGPDAKVNAERAERALGVGDDGVGSESGGPTSTAEPLSEEDAAGDAFDDIIPRYRAFARLIPALGTVLRQRARDRMAPTRTGSYRAYAMLTARAAPLVSSQNAGFGGCRGQYYEDVVRLLEKLGESVPEVFAEGTGAAAAADGRSVDQVLQIPDLVERVRGLEELERRRNSEAEQDGLREDHGGMERERGPNELDEGDSAVSTLRGIATIMLQVGGRLLASADSTNQASLNNIVVKHPHRLRMWLTTVGMMARGELTQHCDRSVDTMTNELLDCLNTGVGSLEEAWAETE